MKLAIDIIFDILFCLALGGFGVYFGQKFLKIKFDFFTAFFIGCSLSICILFMAGLVGLFIQPFFVMFIIMIMLFVLTGRRRLAKWSMSIPRVAVIPLLLTACVLLLIGISSLSPPIKNDTLYYHLGLPKLWAGDGGIKFYPTIALSVTALNCELLLTPIFSQVSPEAAQFFVFLVAVIAMFAAAEGLNRHLGAPHYLALIGLVAVPLFISGMGDAKNDYMAAGFCLIAVFSYLDYQKSKNARYLLLSGIMAGLAAGTKANALIFAIAICLVTVFSKYRWKDFALFFAGLLIFGLPWYIKAYIDTGNPFYPFYNAIFNSNYWRPAFDMFNQMTMPASERKSILNFLTSPFRLVYLPDIFRGRMGPLPLVFLPLLFFIKNLPRAINKILFVSVIYYFIWYFVWANARYLLPIVILLSLIAAYIIYRLQRHSRLAGPAAIMAVCILIGINGVQAARDGIPRIKTAIGFTSREDFLREISVLDPNNLTSAVKVPALPYIDCWQFANGSLPSDAIIGILCSNWNRADGFYLDRRCLYLNPSEQTQVDFISPKEGILNDLKKSKIGFVLIDDNVIDEFSITSNFANVPSFATFAGGVRCFVDIIKENGQPIYEVGRFHLYRMSW